MPYFDKFANRCGRMAKIGLVVLSIVASQSYRVSAEVITFETTPSSSTPVDNAPLTTAYSSGGVDVLFSVDTGGGAAVTPVFEQIGVQAGEAHNGAGTGFTHAGLGDTTAAGFESQLGDWFIRFGDGRTQHTLVIDYTTAIDISGASGEIWDIDAHTFTGSGGAIGAEQWLVSAFDVSDNLLATDTSPVGIDISAPGTLSGKPWQFQFSNLDVTNGGIRKIEVSYIGDAFLGDSVGIAFNNFSPIAAVPEPSSLCGLGLVAVGIATRRRRKNGSST